MKRILFFSLSTFLFILSSYSLSYALTLEEAKRQGYLGELTTGYLGLVNEGAPSEASAIAKEINVKRRLMYKEISKKQGLDLKVVESLAGKKAVAKTPSGLFYKDPQKGWIKK